MTYLQFLLIFIIPIVLFEISIFYRTSYPNKSLIKLGIGVLIFLAVIYTTPWDNYLVKTGVWSYDDSRVLGRLGYVPYEEYAFFVLQTIMTGLWFYFVQKRYSVSAEISSSNKLYYVGIIKLIGITALGFYFLFDESTKYLGLILAWATPVVLLQWCVGGRSMLTNFKIFFLTVLPPTLYLWIVDAIAIHNEVWSISPTQTTGFKIINLPIEEALFFYMTNVMVGQGLLLFVSMKDKIKKWT